MKLLLSTAIGAAYGLAGLAYSLVTRRDPWWTAEDWRPFWEKD